MLNLKCLRKGHEPGKSGEWVNRCKRCGAKL